MIQLTLLRRQHELARAQRQREILETRSAHRSFDEMLEEYGLAPLHATGIQVLQINVGKLCNQTCGHCHVDAGPERRELMSRDTLQACLDVLARTDISVADVTGGAPEMNPHFRWFVGYMRPLDDAGWKLRMQALQGLVRHGQDSISPLLDALKAGDVPQRILAAQTLGYLPPTSRTRRCWKRQRATPTPLSGSTRSIRSACKARKTSTGTSCWKVKGIAT